MACRALTAIEDILSIDSYIYEDPWSWNGGYKTLDNCREMYGAKWCHKAANWIRELPLYYIVDDKLLVHAGLCSGGRHSSDSFVRNGCDKVVKIPGIEEPQWSQHLLWIRERWFADQNNYPYDIIFGHTPTTLNWMDGIRFLHNMDPDYYKLLFLQGAPDNIVRISGFDNGKVRYCIDTGRDRMGLLRLDDYAEFYSDLE